VLIKLKKNSVTAQQKYNRFIIYKVINFNFQEK